MSQKFVPKGLIDKNSALVTRQFQHQDKKWQFHLSNYNTFSYSNAMIFHT